MGSPQNYYGVGTFVNLVAPPPTKNPFANPAGYLASNQTSGASPSAFTAGGAWGDAGNAYTQDTNNATATTTTRRRSGRRSPSGRSAGASWTVS